ncbi:MAG: T9SS type A sorting domain-containing protein [Bacteroidota bacterium]|nr:T9SS type A sorting domain-containing protein [Bacteroidota bacterium]
MVTSNMGCSDTTPGSVISDVHGLTMNTANWNIYPNPSNGQFSIHFNASMQNAEVVRIENMLGEIIIQKEIFADAIFDLSMQASGIYFVRIGNSPAKKLVIE